MLTDLSVFQFKKLMIDAKKISIFECVLCDSFLMIAFLCYIYGTEQGSPTYSPWATSENLLPVFFSGALKIFYWNTTIPISLYIVCGRCLAETAELNTCDSRPHNLQNLKFLTSASLQKKFDNS